MERLKRFGITHPATFARVLADNPDTARKVLNLILGSEIDKLVCTNAEEVVGLWPGNDIKSVRFDVTFKGDRDQKHYVIELQNQIEEFLPQRMRLYQAMLTTENALSGERDMTARGQAPSSGSQIMIRLGKDWEYIPF